MTELRDRNCDRTGVSAPSRRGDMEEGAYDVTSAGETAVSNGEHTPIPIVREPNLSEREGAGGDVRDNSKLCATECGKVGDIDTGVNVTDIDQGVGGVVDGPSQVDVGDVANGKLLAGGLGALCTTAGSDGAERKQRLSRREHHAEWD